MDAFFLKWKRTKNLRKTIVMVFVGTLLYFRSKEMRIFNQCQSGVPEWTWGAEHSYGDSGAQITRTYERAWRYSGKQARWLLSFNTLLIYMQFHFVFSFLINPSRRPRQLVFIRSCGLDSVIFQFGRHGKLTLWRPHSSCILILVFTSFPIQINMDDR